MKLQTALVQIDPWSTSAKSENATPDALQLKLNEIGWRFLSTRLNWILSAADDRLQERAGNATRPCDRAVFFETMRAIRRHDELKANLWLIWNVAVGDKRYRQSGGGRNETRDDATDLQAVCRRAEQAFAEQFDRVRQRMISAHRSEQHTEMPIAPSALCNMFWETLSVLVVESQARKLLCSLIEKFLVEQLGQLYRACHATLDSAGIPGGERTEAANCPTDKQRVAARSGQRADGYCSDTKTIGHID